MRGIVRVMRIVGVVFCAIAIFYWLIETISPTIDSFGLVFTFGFGVLGGVILLVDFLIRQIFLKKRI